MEQGSTSQEVSAAACGMASMFMVGACTIVLVWWPMDVHACRVVPAGFCRMWGFCAAHGFDSTYARTMR